MKPKILITDDEPLTRNLMAQALQAQYECLTASDAEAAMAQVAANPDLRLILTDYKMPGLSGIELIRRAKAAVPALGAILITAFGEIELAVEAMKQGADDFLTKPITDLGQLEIRIANVIRTKSLESEVQELKRELDEKHGLNAFTGSSAVMQRLYERIRKVAPTDATVLIEGPSGSGKELAARAIHALSRRRQGPFIAVECSAFEGELLKSELFGYEPGTFTGALKDGKSGCFENADGGTLFLDEIGEIDLATQIALLRTLETKSVRRLGGTAEQPVDFRLVAATNRDLAAMVRAGSFREDLYYRLNVIDLRTPALSEHPEDIALLVGRFIREFKDESGGAVTGIEPAALKALERAAWPGNVRQLRNVIEKMMVLGHGPKLTLEDIPADITAAATPAPAAPAAPAATTAGVRAPDAAAPVLGGATTLEDAQRRQILATLAECGGNKTAAAARLGISRRTLHRKLNEWKTSGA